MVDIMVTMPKSAGGLKHLQEKIDNLEDGGYAWWWVTGAKELTAQDFVRVVCEGRLRGLFTIKWITTYDEKEHELMVERDGSEFVFRQHTERGPIHIKRKIVRADGSYCWREDEHSFSQADKQLLWEELDKWHRSGKKCIFFGRWLPFLNQGDMKGFQGFRYVRRAER